MEEALGIHGVTITPEPKNAQNITFCPRELVDIEQIKPLLLEHYTQQQIADKLGYTREAISRKIAKWMQTEDFREWAQTLWLKQYNQFSRTEDKEVEAFKALTKIICAQTTRKAEIKTETTIQIDLKAQVAELIRVSEDQCSKPVAGDSPS